MPCEIKWSATNLFAFREHVPEQFSDTYRDGLVVNHIQLSDLSFCPFSPSNIRKLPQIQ
jgi:hypothetical protein